jgi:hypothetical protein
MALYNKDGSVYKLLGPNPQMEEQETWDEFQLHNMKWDSERYRGIMEAISKSKKDPFLSDLEKTKKEISIVSPKPSEQPPAKTPEPIIENVAKHEIKIRESNPQQKPQNPSPSAPSPAKEDLSATSTSELVERNSVVVSDPKAKGEVPEDEIEKVFIHCLPAKMRTKRDDLYGEVVQTIQYGKPTSFEGVILYQSDMELTVWSDAVDLGEGSIIYPKTNYKRWWRLKAKVKKANGWIMSCLISDYQPSFDD